MSNLDNMIFDDGESFIFPYTVDQLISDNPNTVFHDNPSEECLSEFNVKIVKEGNKPVFNDEIQILNIESPEKIDDIWYETYSVDEIWKNDKNIAKEYVNKLREQIIESGITVDITRDQLDDEGNLLFEQINGNPILEIILDPDGNPILDESNNPTYQQSVDDEGNLLFEKIDGPNKLQETLNIVVQLRDEKDFRNLSALNTTAITMQMLGNTSRVINFRDGNDNIFVLEPSDIIQMGIYVTTYMNTIFKKSWELKSLIDSEQDNANILSIILNFNWNN